ncbi:MAG TPA: XTP/dITP diphosphatase [Desulfomonilaceae bacterium]|nr:XTP/dITP diphosphatase [Desulfomonilaceae bacterium]
MTLGSMKSIPNKILVATRNPGKLNEIRALLKRTPIEFVSLASFPELPEVVEDGEMFEENASKKARIMAKATGIVTLADDSGLCIDALNGRPGVLSARYAGEGASDAEKCARILSEMKDVPDSLRTARFVCVLALATPGGEERLFRSACEGRITREPRGAAGFGYDPIFYYPESGCTFAEMDPESKNRVSHRGRALSQLRNYLEELLV